MTATSSSEPSGIDADRLSQWLARRFGQPRPRSELTGPQLLTGGRSNLTYLVEWAGQRLVLRRPPLGPTLATAHDVAREYRVLTALGPTDVAVPRTYGLCPDPEVLGAPFFVMAWVDGRIVRSDTDLARLTHGEALRATDAVIDTLAMLHSLEPAAIGLDDFGHPEGYMARQVRRWRKQLDASLTRELPLADALHGRLAAACPGGSAAALVHGDYKLDNILLDPEDPGRITAVLDWEMSTLGDPRADLAMLCMYWDGFTAVPEAPVGSPGDLAQWPRREYLVDRYASRTTLPLDGLDWYIAFAFYKIAAILEGICFRNPRDGKLEAIARAVPMLIQRGHDTLDGRGC